MCWFLPYSSTSQPYLYILTPLCEPPLPRFYPSWSPQSAGLGSLCYATTSGQLLEGLLDYWACCFKCHSFISKEAGSRLEILFQAYKRSISQEIFPFHHIIKLISCEEGNQRTRGIWLFILSCLEDLGEIFFFFIRELDLIVN